MRLAVSICICLTLVLASSPALAAQDTQPPSSWQQAGLTPEVHAERFLDLMVQGELDSAFKSLLGNSKSDSLDKLKFEIFRNYKKNGKPLGYEKVMEQPMGKSLVRLRYILLFNNRPMMFDIFYYNPGKGWRLRTFTYSTDTKKIFAQ